MNVFACGWILGNLGLYEVGGDIRCWSSQLLPQVGVRASRRGRVPDQGVVSAGDCSDTTTTISSKGSDNLRRGSPLVCRTIQQLRCMHCHGNGNGGCEHCGEDSAVVASLFALRCPQISHAAQFSGCKVFEQDTTSIRIHLQKFTSLLHAQHTSMCV